MSKLKTWHIVVAGVLALMALLLCGFMIWGYIVYQRVHDDLPLPGGDAGDPMQRRAVCTPPACRAGEVYHCPGECPGGCGTICVTPVP